MDHVRDRWIPTDAGALAPAEVLLRASTTRWPRGDWDAATVCLLQAMLQTAVVLEPARCPNLRAWRALLAKPPADLPEWFSLDLGDAAWQCAEAQGLVPVAALLPDSPGENAVRKASDISVWKQDVPESLSGEEALIAVISDNFWGTRIGTGHYQGARGEQSLTTLVEPVDPSARLWKRVWLNVMPADRWNERYPDTGKQFRLPWTVPISSTPITPDNSHSLAVLWQMPRRWRLVVDADGRVREVHRQNKGRQYEGWEHPLSPYFIKADGTWTPAKVSAHTGYRDWAGIALAARPKTKVAVVVSEFIEQAWDGEALRIRCCGWALGDRGEAGAWVDHVVPFYVSANADAVADALNVAEETRKRLWGALTKVGKELGRYADDIYPASEVDFYRHVASNDWATWSSELRAAASRVFWSVMDSHRLDAFKAYGALQRAGFALPA